MRQIIVTEFISLDGIVDSPGGESGYAHAGWTFKEVKPDMAAYELKGREQEEAGALLVGRVSWDAFHPVWPTMKEFGRYNEIPKYVVSTTLTEEVVAASTWQPATSVIDRYHLLVFPLILGHGKRLFAADGAAKQNLRLVEHDTYGNGIQKLCYEVVR